MAKKGQKFQRYTLEFKAEAPNDKWVTSITYLPFNGRFLYLLAIPDLYNDIVAYHISEHNGLKRCRCL